MSKENKQDRPAAPEETYHCQLPFFIRKTLGLLSKYRFPYDEAVKFRFGEPTYMLTNPADIRHVLVANADNYNKPAILTSDQGKKRVGRGLLTSTGAEHLKQRKLLRPNFRRHSIERFAEIISERIERMLLSWQGRPQIDIAAEMEDLAQAAIIGALFGDSIQHSEAELIEAVRIRRRYTEYLFHSHLPFRQSFPSRIARLHNQAMQTIDRVLYAAIADRRASPTDHDDIMAYLMNATYPDGSHMSDEQIRDELLTFTSTGYETIGDAMGWTWYLLAQHPEIEMRLLAELDTILADKSPNSENIQKLQYTEMILSESLRLYPPTWIYVRVPKKADLLPSGVEVPPNAKLYLSQYVMHRHPRYFPAPETFDPERFRDPAARGRYRYAYFPFGDGLHRCIGENFARLEGILILASVAKRYSIVLEGNQNITPYAGITLRPKNGIQVRVSRREVSVPSPLSPHSS